MTNLLKIRKEYLNAIEMVDEDWVITEEWLELINKSELSIKEKSVNIAKLIWMFDNNLEAIKKEKDRLSKIEKSYKSNKQKVKDWLSYNLQETWIEKLDTELYKISFRKSTAVEIIDEELIPDEFFTEKLVKSLDKKRIWELLKNWTNISWVKLKQNNNLQIK